jgi:hypothetical protein
MPRLLGLHLKLRLTRLDWSGLRPTAQQAAARSRLCAGAVGPPLGALYGFGCGFPRPVSPDALPKSPGALAVRRAAAEVAT